MNDVLSRAADRIAARDWAGASEALESLRAREDLRAKATAEVRHEIANAVAAVRANVEGMIEGVIEPTHERLEALRETLTGITIALDTFLKSS